MTKSLTIKPIGEIKSPSLQPTETALKLGADQALSIVAERPPQAPEPGMRENAARALKAAHASKGPSTTCKQILWLSFFFDGTGNNLDADVGLLKHSNIARLYRAHKRKDPEEGTLSVYIPGVGTYFPDIGDDGGGRLGLGCGAKGEERLDFALGQFDAFLAEPLARANAPTNAIREINIAVFGFSRGAALSRAFVNMLMERRCVLRGGKWVLQSGAWPVRFRFLGLFDTVASVGVPLSFNTTGMYETYSSDTAGMIAKRLNKYKTTRPEALAFSVNAAPGADPAPGDHHGHRGWGSRLQIPETVEEVRHFVAAHEVRNSFPLDSVSIYSGDRISKPEHFHETVYPGAHSDVGGGYAPGEGARGLRPSERLSLIPLRHMYQFALRQGVPMLAEWLPINQTDFDIDSRLREAYDCYLKEVGSFGGLGAGVNRHMALYYAWRFRSIKLKAKGDVTEAKLIRDQEDKFRKQDAAFTDELDRLAAKETLAKLSLDGLVHTQDMQTSSADGGVAQEEKTVSDADVETARKKYDHAHNEHLRAKARKDSLPDMKKFIENLDIYDRQLLADVQAIHAAVRNSAEGKKRSDLRPHYLALLTAYENEFQNDKGLKNEGVIRFFDNYVHDSLAGFGKDATLPSDPRVVYLGGNEKYWYAKLDMQNMVSDGDKMPV